MRIALGISDFLRLRQDEYSYIDKSLLIRDVIDEGSQVILLPRPRRFGKTINLSMLRYYFERSAEERWSLFEGLAIAQAGERYRAHFQRYPTIHLTFKDIKDDTWEQCLASTARLLTHLYEEHSDLLPKLEPWQQRTFLAVLEGRAEEAVLKNALLDLSKLLAQHHGQRALVLIDEYDTPLHTAHLHGYYEPAMAFYRTLLSAVLKDNVHLHKGVLTGVLRVAKDNIFTGLNNIDVYSFLTRPYATAFGFTQQEVEALLAEAGLSARLPEVQRWYNGYLFGEQVIYNPWSVLSFVKHQPEQPAAYWASSSGNDLVRELLEEHGAGFKPQWEQLLRGETIEQTLVENVALRDLTAQPQWLWSVIAFSGYLKVLARRQLPDGLILGTFAIPNLEVMNIFREQFTGWLNAGLGGDEGRKAFLKALLAGDAALIEEQLARWLLRSVSYHDTAQVDEPERFYHGLLLGLLVSLEEHYEVRSNPEVGYGRCDVLITPRQPGRPGVALELKVASARRKETLAAALKAAQRQLIEQDYAAGLRARGAEPVHELAVAWLGKEVRVAPARPPAPREAKRRAARPRRGKASPS